MVVEEMRYQLVDLLAYFFVLAQLVNIERTERIEHAHRQLCEDFIVVILAYREVDVVTRNHI